MVALSKAPSASRTRRWRRSSSSSLASATARFCRRPFRLATGDRVAQETLSADRPVADALAQLLSPLGRGDDELRIPAGRPRRHNGSGAAIVMARHGMVVPHWQRSGDVEGLASTPFGVDLSWRLVGHTLTAASAGWGMGVLAMRPCRTIAGSQTRSASWPRR